MMKNYLSDLSKLALTILFFSASCSFPLSKAIVQVKVGVIFDDLNSGSAKSWSSCIKTALSDFYHSHNHYKTRLILNIRDSNRSEVGAAAAAIDLIQNEQVQAIIGPTTSTETSFVINLGEQAHVPIISFSATSPALTSTGSSYFFQFAQNDSSQVKAVSDIVKAFGWRQVVPICIDTLHGRGILPFLADALQEVGTGIPYLSVISPSASDDQIVEELYKLMMMQTRVFIVHMPTDMCTRLFTKAKEIGMMSEGYVWLTTSVITNRMTSLNSSVIHSMNGVIGVQTYVPITGELEDFKLRWRQKFRNDYPDIVDVELDVFGIWAYDATFSIAMAIEQVIGTTSSFGFQTPISSNKSTDILESLPVSPYGPRLCNALSTTRFLGLAGDFILIDRQLQASHFRIINVNGGGARPIGFWTPHNGLASKFSSPNSTRHLGPVIWPGESLSVPKGWEIPTKGKKLRIGVPVKDSFTEFVKVTTDTTATTTRVSGFSIDVFKAVVEMLPYALPYEFIPFAKADGTEAGSYDDLCYQVYLGNFDAVVGDITITAKRSLYVDFTLPYTEPGAVMVVPIIDTNRRSAWAFLKPLRWEMWLTTIIFFFMWIGFVVWVLERRINEDLWGRTAEKEVKEVNGLFWFSFSTMVFAHRERIISNLARVVWIIWIFSVLILISQFQKSLISKLTVEELDPPVTNIRDLLKKGKNIGYVPTAYTYKMLKHVGFHDSKLMPLQTMEEIDEALSRGSENSGIAAFVDEAPYMKLFIARYCYKYTMIGPIFESDGHGFVFPKRSPLLSDVSQAVLNVAGREKIRGLEDKWFKKESSCRDFTNRRSFSRNHQICILLANACVISLGVACYKQCFKRGRRNRGDGRRGDGRRASARRRPRDIKRKL